jgi:hypothetical protein
MKSKRSRNRRFSGKGPSFRLGHQNDALYLIDSREQLIDVLTEAAGVEHNLLCSYLYAGFSLKGEAEIKKGEAEIKRAKRARAVERWQGVQQILVNTFLPNFYSLELAHKMLIRRRTACRTL